MGFMSNGVATGGLPLHLVKPLLDKYDIPFMVETGTANAESTRLSATMFRKVWTIELIDGRTETKDAPDNISFLVGDSTYLLPPIIEELLSLRGNKERQFVLFYLDAHYSDIVPNESDYPECPVLDEIKCVAEYGEDAIIIIDDARLFFGSPPYPHDPRQWPSICDIFVLLKEKFPYHHITITDDYILAIPIHVKDVIDKEWRDRFHIRYPNDADKLRGQYKDVWKDVKNRYSEFLKYVE
jgi:hypothetical protein